MTTPGSNGNENHTQPGVPFDRSLLAELVHGRLSPDKALQVLDHTDADPDLSKELDLVILMMEEGTQEGGSDATSYPRGTESGPSVRESRQSVMRMLRVAAVLVVFLGGAWFLDVATTPPFARIARVDTPDLHLRVRDGSSALLGGARAYLYDGNWAECARRSEWYLSVYPEGDERTTAMVLRSAAFLMGARTHVLGFHVRYDPARVDTAVASLQRARASVLTVRESEEIDWFEAKASLMRGDRARARACLEAIVRSGGARVQDARAMLVELAEPGP